jgi:hypothetical protein
MLEEFFNAPVTLWLVSGLLLAFIAEAFRKWEQPWAVPALTVYGTVGIWYVVDYLISGWTEFRDFADEIEFSLLQVAACLVGLRIFIPSVLQRFLRGQHLEAPFIALDQSWITYILNGGIAVWIALTVIAIQRLREFSNFEELWPAIFWPPLYTSKVSMFAHEGLGNSTSFIWAALGYIQRLNCAIFGVVAVVGTGRTRKIALVMVAITWPYIFFDRIRNAMLALILPALAAFWICSYRPILLKIATSLLLFFAVDYWFKVVLAYRSDYEMVTFQQATGLENERHYGLDMLKELCYINRYIQSGTYQPNWGSRYFAELVNFIPRGLWPGKPTLGIDYAIARGFADSSEMGVNVTVSTGLIGQGIVNFGPYLGVIAVSFLLALWIGFLGRLWNQRRSMPRLVLFLVGVGVTFNCGRDITLLVLFPFVFGYMFVIALENINRKASIAVLRRLSVASSTEQKAL